MTHWLIGDNWWNYNYEHPPLVKFLIGLAIYFNKRCGSLLNELQAARLPSSVFGSLLIAALYWLGRAPFGRPIALATALSLAFSPWLVYFSALAYLDMTMTALITTAYLLLWPAIQRPQLYPLIAVLVALAVDSKYTAALVIPGMVMFTLYYFLALRPRLPIAQRPAIPWNWWLLALVLCPLTFLVADPIIWPHPVSLLLRSFLYEWNHASEGHLTFLAGTASLHMPQWAILYIILTKISALVTIPTLFFVVFAIIRLVCFHLSIAQLQYQEASRDAFLLIWLLATLLMFSRLNIVVGTHYHLPVAPPLTLAGVTGLTILLRYLPVLCRGAIMMCKWSPLSSVAARFIAPGAALQAGSPRDESRGYGRERKPASFLKTLDGAATNKGRSLWQRVIASGVLVAVVGLPHLLGLATTYGAEGYTSEMFRGENTTIQVAYPGYRDAILWLAQHTEKRPARIGLVGLENALGESNYGTSWYTYNGNVPHRFQLTEAHPDDYNLSYDYLVWPMHLVQRGYTIPPTWQQRIVQTISGGNTIYCYILARNPATIT